MPRFSASMTLENNLYTLQIPPIDLISRAITSQKLIQQTVVAREGSLYFHEAQFDEKVLQTD